MTPLPDPVAAAESPRALADVNRWLANQSAQDRVAWALETLAGTHALSSSFGAQAAVSLHLVTQQVPLTPIILIDTGHLFPETYRFVEQLTERLDLNLKTYRPCIANAWTHTRIEQLRERGSEAIAQYNRAHKIEPMQRALNELGVSTWIAGIRRGQSTSRAGIDFLELRHGRWKLHPLADWSDRDIGRYLAQHDLPYHPLWDQGYVSIGDVHTTHRLEPDMDPEATRFFGLQRECGLHFDISSQRVKDSQVSREGLFRRPAFRDTRASMHSARCRKRP